MTTRPPLPRALRATAIIATIGVAVSVLGLLATLRPVRTPTQDCGLAAAFLLSGRVNEYADETAPPRGVTKAEAKANNRRPCRPRVADAARPGIILFVSGLLVALVATIVELLIRLWGWRKRRVAAR